MEKGKFFIWIRRSPLKRPESAKGIQGNPSFFPCISLHKLGRCAARLALPIAPDQSERTSLKPGSIAFQFADVLLCVKLKAKLFNQG